MWHGRGQKKERVYVHIVFPPMIIFFSDILFLGIILITKNINHLPFDITTARWGKKGHGVLCKGAEQGGGGGEQWQRAATTTPLSKAIKAI
jgi:hypothetical protein